MKREKRKDVTTSMDPVLWRQIAPENFGWRWKLRVWGWVFSSVLPVIAAIVVLLWLM